MWTEGNLMLFFFFLLKNLEVLVLVITFRSVISQGKSGHLALLQDRQCGGRQAKVVRLGEVEWSSWADVGWHLQKVVNGSGARVVLCPRARL